MTARTDTTRKISREISGTTDTAAKQDGRRPCELPTTAPAIRPPKNRDGGNSPIPVRAAHDSPGDPSWTAPPRAGRGRSSFQGGKPEAAELARMVSEDGTADNRPPRRVSLRPRCVGLDAGSVAGGTSDPFPYNPVDYARWCSAAALPALSALASQHTHFPLPSLA